MNYVNENNTANVYNDKTFILIPKDFCEFFDDMMDFYKLNFKDQ